MDGRDAFMSAHIRVVVVDSSVNSNVKVGVCPLCDNCMRSCVVAQYRYTVTCIQYYALQGFVKYSAVATLNSQRRRCTRTRCIDNRLFKRVQRRNCGWREGSWNGQGRKLLAEQHACGA